MYYPAHESHVPTSNFFNVMLSFGLIPVINRPSRITIQQGLLLIIYLQITIWGM